MPTPELDRDWSKLAAVGAAVAALGSVLPWAELSVAEGAASPAAGDTVRSVGGLDADGLVTLALSVAVVVLLAVREEDVLDAAAAAAAGVVTFGVGYSAYDGVARYRASLSGVEADLVSASAEFGLYLVLFGGFLVVLGGVSGVVEERG